MLHARSSNFPACADKKFKISNSSGFTLVELVIVISILGILYAVTFWAIEPDLIKKNARDGVRITDVGRLQGAVENYIADQGFPPDLNNSLRQSSVPASPSASPAAANGSGWIGQDLRQYLEKLPTDPLNSGIYVYRYKRVGQNYELDAALENNSNVMTNDGGNSATRYEKGTDPTILGN